MNTSIQAGGDVRRARELMEMPVYSIAEGRLLGQIDSLYVRSDDRSIPLVRLGRSLSTWHAFVPYHALRTVGVDIALVETENVLLEQADRDGLETNLPGRPVLTQSGESVGKLIGFGVEGISGKIAYFRVEVNAGFLGRLVGLVKDNTVEIPEAMVIVLGPDAMIVRDDAQETAPTAQPGEA